MAKDEKHNGPVRLIVELPVNLLKLAYLNLVDMYIYIYNFFF